MQVDWKPKVGMVFEGFDDAWNFWVDYGRRVGFGARKEYSHKKKDGSYSSIRFVCCKEGLRKADKRDYKIINPKPETRCNCPAKLGIKNMGGKLTVHEFVEEHNHILQLPETTHVLSSQCKISEVQCHQIDLTDDAGLQQHYKEIPASVRIESKRMQVDWKPIVGMVFENFDDAWNFWVDYGGRVGFGARKEYSHKKKDGSYSSIRFVCCKEGLRKTDKRDYKTINPKPETRCNCPAKLGIKNMAGKLTVHEFVEEHNHILQLPETTHMLSSQRKISEVQCHQIDLADDAGLQQHYKEIPASVRIGSKRMQVDWKPKVGMVFESFDDAWNFWVDYGRRVGFGARKEYSHKKKDGSYSSIRFVCCKEGLRKADKRDYKIMNPKPETRCNCPAKLGIKNMGGKLTVHEFVEEHNHILQLPKTTRMLSSQRKISEVQCHQIDIADDAGLQQRYEEICPRLIRIATEACRSQETFMFLRKVIDDLDREILEFQNKQVSSAQLNGYLKEIESISDGSTQVKGFKKKEGKRGSKRIKSCVEHQLIKRKKYGGSSTSKSEEPTMVAQVLMPKPTWLNDAYNQPSMAQHDEDITTLTKS